MRKIRKNDDTLCDLQDYIDTDNIVSISRFYGDES